MPQAVKITKKSLDMIEARCDIHKEELQKYYMNSYLVINLGITYPWAIMTKKAFKKNFAFVGDQMKHRFTEVVML